MKKDEIAGQIFEDELELAYGMLNAAGTRGKKDGHRVERFRFQH